MATIPTHGPGTTLGPYRIEELVARGGMGVVYRATDLRLGRPVALKLLSPELSGDRRFRARFERESRLAASIDHGGIIPIYDAGDADGLLYIAMRYVDGSDLAGLLRREGALDPLRALDLVGQLAEALDAAHARGLIHRDVKPSNALVARDGAREHVYLADFGLTKSSGPDSVTASGQMMGTVAYMAPEVIRGDEPSAAADRYALGCVLFECLTGEVPFGGTNAAAVIYGHLETPPPAAHDRAAHLPVAVDAVLRRALAKDPRERFESGSAMVDAARAALGGTPAARATRRRRAPSRRAAMLAGALAAAVVAAVAVVVALVGRDAGTRLASVRNDAVAVIDPGGRALRAQVGLDGPPSAVAAADDAIWVAGDRDGTVSRIDPKSHTIRQTIAVGHGPSALAADRDGVWVANRQDGTLARIAAATNSVVDTVKAGSPADVCQMDGALWVAGATAGALLRLDTATHRRRVIALDMNPVALACGEGGVWALGDGGRLVQVSPAGNSVLRSVDVGAGAAAVVAGAGAVWVANPLAGTVSKVDPGRAVVTATVPLGPSDEPVALAVGAGGVWVANRQARTLARIDPARGVVSERLQLGNEPRALTVVDGRLWVAVAATGAGHRGGTLRVSYEKPPIGRVDLDPATAYVPEGWQILSTTNDGLTGFRRVGGPAGATIVPDLAEAVPAPSDGGRTYTFTMRRGIRWSDGRPVRPSDVKRGVERSMHAKPRTFGLLSGIRSVTADDAHRTVVFRLARPDPDFLYRLALPFAYPVPPGSPAPPRVLPATGPYRIARFEPGRRVRLERNRFFRTWSAPAKPDGYPDVIDIQLSVTPTQAIDAVRAGRTDWASVPLVLPLAFARLRREDPGLIRDMVSPATSWFWLNTRVAPFDRVDVRRAVGLAIDRGAVVAAVGGENVARPTCHILPPTFQGYRPGCPSGPQDLAAARRLVARSGTEGARVTVWSGTPGFDAETPRLVSALRALGYRTRERRLSMGRYFNTVADRRTRAQAGPTTWIADYPSPSTFLSTFSCGGLSARSVDNSNYSQFCDPAVDTLMARAGALQPTDPRAAEALWARAERRVLAAAPAVPLYNSIDAFLVSTRLRNDQYSPQWGMLLDQAWVR